MTDLLLLLALVLLSLIGSLLVDIRDALRSPEGKDALAKRRRPSRRFFL